jgi:uncharacterized protein (TIGR02246 family)
MHDDESAIRDVISTWIAATRDGDHATVLDLMTEDVVFLRAGSAPMIGKPAFAATMQGPDGAGAARIEARSEIRELQVHGDWAHAWTHLTVVVTASGAPPVTRAGDTLSLFRKQDGRWRLARDANLLAPVASAGEP